MNESVTNGTAFGRWPLSRSVPVIGVLLVGFFVVIEPKASQGLAAVERTLFWALHVSTGLAGLLVASWLLMSRWTSRLSPAAMVFYSGLIAAILTLPVFFVLELLLPVQLQAEEYGQLDAFAESGIWQALLVEAISVVPTMMLTWFLVNLPLVFPRADLHRGDIAEDIPERDAANRERREQRNAFLARLPDEVGVDVYAVSSDLHYLHVHTAMGKCMIHGSMRIATESLAELGQQVHRSHWVARHAVSRIVRNGTQTYCVLVNGLRLPVSRRKRKLVQDWLDKDDRVSDAAPGISRIR